MTEISIAKDFSPTPGGRTSRDGPYSGEAFRNRVLIPALDRTRDKLVIVLDGVAGLPPSFLEEAFGGLVRSGFVTADELLSRLSFRASDRSLKARSAMIERFVKEARLLPA